MSTIPAWPAKLTREQQKAATQRRKDFDVALKRGTQTAGWRYARGTIFKQSGAWFIGISPSLLWERGALVRVTVKPMALDPLFWEIVGLNENKARPLSFRATGAWVLRPFSKPNYIGLHITGVEPLAAEVLRWGGHQTNRILQDISILSMIAEIPKQVHLRSTQLTLNICLHILAGDLDGAIKLCGEADPDTHPLKQESGGFVTHKSDGSVVTFSDQAREWIAHKRQTVACSG